MNDVFDDNRIRIFVISLERAKERIIRLGEQLQKLDFENDFTVTNIQAVDGELLNENQKNLKISLPGGYRYGEQFRPGEIGCTLPHIKAIMMARNYGLDKVIILEDDVVLAEDFGKRIKFLLRILPEDWEHVYLSGVPRTPGYAVHYNANLSFLNVVPSPVIDCIPATMVRKTAYDKMINYLAQFQTTTDDSIIQMIHVFENLRSYTYFPFCATVEDDYTYIWNEKVNREHKSKIYFKNKL